MIEVEVATGENDPNLPAPNELRVAERDGQWHRGGRLDHDLQSLPDEPHGANDGLRRRRGDGIVPIADDAEGLVAKARAQTIRDRVRIGLRNDMSARKRALRIIGARRLGAMDRNTGT